MSVRDFLILGLFVAFIFAGIYGYLYRIEEEIKQLSVQSQDVSECYDIDELNLIICKKGK